MSSVPSFSTVSRVKKKKLHENFSKCFVEFINEAIWAKGILCVKVLVANSTYLIIIGWWHHVIIIGWSYFFCEVTFTRNMLISTKFSNLYNFQFV